MIDKALDDPPFDRIADAGKTIGMVLVARIAAIVGAVPGSYNYIGLSGDESLSQSRKPGCVALGIADVHDQVLAHDVTTVP